MTRRKAALLVASLTALLAAPAAFAHVSFSPSEVPARSLARLQVQVPNEKPDARTVRVALEIPDAVQFVRVPDTPGWRTRLTREPLDEPLLVNGRLVENRITAVEWRGGEIAGSASQSFALRIAVPRLAGQSLPFRATQTYSDGDVVGWVEPPGSANPAPQLSITAPDPSAESVTIRPAPPPPPPPPPPATTTEPEEEQPNEEDEAEEQQPEAVPAPAADEDDGGLSVPLLLAIAVAVAAVLAAAGLLIARRRRAAG